MNDILNKPGFWRLMGYIAISVLTVINLWVLHNLGEVAEDLRLQPGFLMDRNVYQGFVGPRG